MAKQRLAVPQGNCADSREECSIVGEVEVRDGSEFMRSNFADGRRFEPRLRAFCTHGEPVRHRKVPALSRRVRRRGRRSVGRYVGAIGP